MVITWVPVNLLAYTTFPHAHMPMYDLKFWEIYTTEPSSEAEEQRSAMRDGGRGRGRGRVRGRGKSVALEFAAIPHSG